MKKQIISMAVMAVVFAACGGSKAPATVVGSWVMPINGQPGEVQGIKLEENGEASSINMHTLVYKEWEQQGDQLYLKEKSIGNVSAVRSSKRRLCDGCKGGNYAWQS